MSSLTDATSIHIFRAQRAAQAAASGGSTTNGGGGGGGAAPVTAAEVSDLYDPQHDRVRELRPALPSAARPDIDARLVAILDARPAYGETVHATYARKEQELAAVFAELDAVESLVMHRRLVAAPRPGDALAEKFARLVVDRRHRLLVFIADARRRAARAARR